MLRPDLKRFALAAGLGLALACGGGGGSPQAPAITSFAPAAALVTAGSGTTLTAVFGNGTGTVAPGLGAITSGVALATGTLAATTTYTLTVTGASGQTTSQTTTITVVPPPLQPVITVQANVTAGAPGYIASVPAQAGCTFTWTLTGGTLTAGGTSSQITFAAGAAGTLQLGCTATNAAGTVSSQGSATSTAVPPPGITSFTAAASPIPAGTGTTLTAVFAGGTGSIAPGALAAASGTPVATPSLAATTAYTLTVTNAAGTQATAAVTVAVLSAPAILVQPQSLTATAGQPATFGVLATGTAPLTYQWLLDGTPIPGAASAFYTTPPTTASASGGQYSAVVANGEGSTTTTAATLTVSATPAPVAVTVGTAATGLRLAQGCAGFSYEKSHLTDALFNASNAGLVALFTRLGPGLLRVGGNSVDQTTWTPNGAGLTAGQIAPADVDRLAGFLKAANWKVIYGLNFATNTAAGMAAEAAYAASSLGGSLYGFELGNEPDLYASNGLRAKTYTFANFLAEWRAYAAAIQAQVPGAVFTGPASAYNTSGYTAPFAAAEGQGLALLTQHYYRANGQLATSTIELLLTPDPALPATLQALKTAAGATGYRLAEANSFYNGGAPNVSDAYGTALWAIDFLFTNALNGSEGVNCHGGGDGPGYTPIADNGTAVVAARPEYYGMDLVALAGPGGLLDTTVASGGLALSAYAVAADAGSLNLVLVNKDPGQVAQVTITLGAPATTATLTVLTGAGLNSTTGTLLGGAPIGADGSWSPQAAPVVAVTGSTLTLTLAPATAVLAQVQ